MYVWKLTGLQVCSGLRGTWYFRTETDALAEKELGYLIDAEITRVFVQV